ncbi:interleukin 17a/f1 [Brachyhypopomus gauderio]|uniref:interleukin 17a/f1 n=1 Tax=Brachyhypopomus gauderio TaxID=698409 RepID=UPI004042EC13
MMSSALKLPLFMVAYVMGVIIMGVQASPKRQPHGGPHKGQEPPSYRLILDQQLKAPSNHIRPINNDSISPWEYIYTHNDSLIPSHIAEAKCLLSGCLNVSGEEVRDMESRPILKQILVLRRVRGDQHSYHFQLEYKTISVGCTCIRPYVEHV